MALFELNDVGIDLGTSSVLVYVRNKGIVLREPSVVAVEKITGRIIAIGDSSITGDGTNFLGIKLKNDGYKELDNKAFLINAMEWLRHSKK